MCFAQLTECNIYGIILSDLGDFRQYMGRNSLGCRKFPIQHFHLSEEIMKLVYRPEDKPKFGQLIIFAIQQLLAIMAATIAVPAIVGNGMTASAALFGAGVGTLVYQLLTKFKSPVFLGSSFAFIGSMFAAFVIFSSAA